VYKKLLQIASGWYHEQSPLSEIDSLAEFAWLDGNWTTGYLTYPMADTVASFYIV